jgi:hypothetical protein
MSSRCRRSDALAARLCTLLWLVFLVGFAMPAFGATYYMATNGSDSASGSQASPWKTLDASAAKLSAGDTLILRGGTYYERGIEIDIQGSASSPITIRAMAGESPVIDGGSQEFRTPGNDDWELVNAATHLYRSKSSYTDGIFGGYLSYGGKDYKLVSYESMGHLTTSNQRYSSGDIYVGQGLRGDAGRIYVRLEKGELQQVQGITDPPTLDPNLASLAIFDNADLVDVSSAAKHVVIDGIDFVNAYTPFRFASGASYVTVKNGRIRGGRYHFRIHPGAHHLTFDNLLIDDAVPDWIAWQDVKSGDKPAHQMQGAGFDISGNTNNVEIANCTIRGVFDGIDANGDPFEFDVHHNTFSGIRDDAFSLGTASHDIHIHHNIMAPVYTSVGRYGQGTNPKPGSTFIHHNVVDASLHMQHGRMNPDGTWRGGTSDGKYTVHAIAANHTSSGFGEGDAWKIYHNTFIGNDDDEGNHGIGHTKQQHADAVHEVYNNIFIQLDDHYIARHPKAGTQFYDGNLYWRPVEGAKKPIFYDFERQDGSRGYDYDDLAEFLSSSFHRDTGWDANSVQADPQLDAEYRPAASGPAASGAVALPSGLPGNTGETFRGALAPVGGGGGGGTPPPPAAPDPPTLLQWR